MYRRYQPYHLVLASISVLFLHVLLTFNNVCAQPMLRLILDPDKRTLSIGTKTEEIWIQAQITKEDVQLQWKFHGPGEFKKIEFGGIYTAPNEIKGKSAKATITAIVTDKEGNTVTDSVVFTLIAPKSPESEVTPTPTPTPILTPTPTSKPSPSPTPANFSKINRHLQNAEFYFKKRRFTTPLGKSAFDEYKAVLKLDSANRQAREGLYRILEKYKRWADGEYRKGKYDKAKTLYQRYQVVADYMLNTLGEQSVKQELRDVKNRLAQKPTPTPSPTATVPPTPTPTMTPVPIPCDELWARFTNRFNSLKTHRQEYDELTNYKDEAICYQMILILTNIVEASKRIREVLTYQTTSGKCFTPEEITKLKWQISQIDQILTKREKELSFIKEQCKSIPTRSCEELERLLSGLFENLNQELKKYQRFANFESKEECNQRLAALTKIIENLQELHETLTYQTAFGECLTPEERVKIKSRVSQIERDMTKYEQEFSSVSKQCYTASSCEELEILLSLLFENLRQDLKEYDSICQQKITTLTHIIEDLRATQQLLHHIAPGECFTSEEAQKVKNRFPQIEQDIIRYEQELSLIKRQCKP